MNDIAGRLEIEQLIYRYSHSLDEGDGDRFVSLFVAEGEIALRSGFAGKSGVDPAVPWLEPGLAAGGHLVDDVLVFRGRDRLRAFSSQPVGPTRSFHVVSQPVVEFDTTTSAHARSYMRVYSHSYGGAPGLLAIGSYRDRFVLTDDGWRFERRLCEV